MKTCDFGATHYAPSDCGREARYQAVLLVRAAAGVKATEVAVDWFACSRHCVLTTVDDIVTAEGWDYIVLDHKRHGRIPPAKAHTTLRFRRL